MPLPMSKSQIERLGARLVRSGGSPADEDLDALHRLLSAYGATLERTSAKAREALGVAPTARVKNTGTILEKLDRYGGSWLKSLQDIAGMRIVGDFDRTGQNELVAAIVELFGSEERPPKVVDRRAQPVQGYRAVHVIVFPDGIPVEIQVRTSRQHEWAELFEKLADRVGRGVRYGEPPKHWLSESQRLGLAGELKAVYETSFALRQRVVDLALATGAFIAEVEKAEVDEPDAPELTEYRKSADEAISDLRTALDAL